MYFLSVPKTIIAFVLVASITTEGGFSVGMPGAEIRRMHNAQEEDANYWFEGAQRNLAHKLSQRPLEREAKNIMFFLGDGMSLTTATAARIHKGQLANRPGGGEEEFLFFETFPNIGLSKTYCVDRQVPDSACTATAFLGGVKTNMGTIGVTPNVKVKDCAGQNVPTNHVPSLLKLAQAANKSTGIVTTTRITHATPAGAYAHVAFRQWENDHTVKHFGQNPDTCDDIAEQLILGETGKRFNVILGGGRQEFLSAEHLDPATNQGGNRRDSKNLIEMWQSMKSGEKSQYVWNKEQFENVDPDQTDYLLGLFSSSHMAYTLDNSTDEPTLPEMTEKAVKILQRNPNGFVLFVEGGKIDHAHHANFARKALAETIAMDEAVHRAVNMTDAKDTLTLVTADHSHVFTFAGYAPRGNPILEFGGNSDQDGLPYTSLGYMNGPGYRPPTPDGNRYDISNDNLHDVNYQHPAGLPMKEETHAGEDVIVYSQGPWSHLLTGVFEQCYIPHVLNYAACMGKGLKFCAREMSLQ